MSTCFRFAAFSWTLAPGFVLAQTASLQLSDGSGVAVATVPGHHVVAQGWNGYGQTSVPKGENEVIGIAAGVYHTVALRQDGSVIAWGLDAYGLTSVPNAAKNGVIAVAAGYFHTMALKQDGSVIAWGENEHGQSNVPVAAQSGVVAIAAGDYHAVALKQNGRVVAWGLNDGGQTDVPAAAQSGVVAIAAGNHHTMALKQNGSVIMWGRNDFGETITPNAARSGVVSIAAGYEHSVALKQDGSVMAWGWNGYGQTSVPNDALSGVVAIAARYDQTAALKQDGRVVAWGFGANDRITVPKAAQSGVAGVALGESHIVFLVENAGEFGARKLGEARDHGLSLDSIGARPLTDLRAVIEGPDADQFTVVSQVPDSMAPASSAPITLRFQPTRLGPLIATLKIYSNTPQSPFILPLQGSGNFNLTATKPGVFGSNFTYAPLRLDRQSGVMLQKITFTNTTGVKIEGLKLILSNVALGVQIYSSSLGSASGTYEVIYSKPIAANETIRFDLVYFDPQRRTADSINPTIKVEALLEPEPDSLPVTGTRVPLLSVRVTPQGPRLEWNSVPKATYVVEYSDDGGKAWFSAVHRLNTGGTRQIWIDRGQPETKTKPVGLPNKPGGRLYRVKKL